jgi:hypothetical protein
MNQDDPNAPVTPPTDQTPPADQTPPPAQEQPEAPATPPAASAEEDALLSQIQNMEKQEKNAVDADATVITKREEEGKELETEAQNMPERPAPDGLPPQGAAQEQSAPVEESPATEPPTDPNQQ